MFFLFLFLSIQAILHTSQVREPVSQHRDNWSSERGSERSGTDRAVLQVGEQEEEGELLRGTSHLLCSLSRWKATACLAVSFPEFTGEKALTQPGIFQGTKGGP